MNCHPSHARNPLLITHKTWHTTHAKQIVVTFCSLGTSQFLFHSEWNFLPKSFQGVLPSMHKSEGHRIGEGLHLYVLGDRCLQGGMIIEATASVRSGLSSSLRIKTLVLKPSWIFSSLLHQSSKISIKKQCCDLTDVQNFINIYAEFLACTFTYTVKFHVYGMSISLHINIDATKQVQNCCTKNQNIKW